MNSLTRFTEGMERLIGKAILLDELGYESLCFEKEEIDEKLIPKEVLAPLKEPIVPSSVDYTDEEGHYYLYLAVCREDIKLEPYEVRLVNGEVIGNIFGGSDDVR